MTAIFGNEKQEKVCGLSLSRDISISYDIPRLNRHFEGWRLLVDYLHSFSASRIGVNYVLN